MNLKKAVSRKQRDLSRWFRRIRNRSGLDLDELDFFVSAPLQAASALSSDLAIDENGFAHSMGISHADPRAYFFYGATDEVMRAATAALRWQEMVSGPPPKPETDPMGKRILRVVGESITDEQDLWTRKLIEHLITAIGFSQYNKPELYRGFLAAAALQEHLFLGKDFKDFYNCNNLNNQESIKHYSEVIEEVQKKENLPTLPFLNQPISSTTPPKGQLFKTLRARYIEALPLATAEEKIVLRLSYNLGYSGPSRSMHGAVSRLPAAPRKDAIASGICEIGLISFDLLHRCHDLLGIPTKGISKQIQDGLRTGSVAPSLISEAGREYLPGDLVLAYGELSEIVAGATSAFGYKSYTVRFLSKPPLHNVPEDAYPVRYIRLIMAKTKAREFWEKNLSRTPQGLAAWAKFKDQSDDRMYDGVKWLLKDFADKNILHLLLSPEKKSSASKGKELLRAVKKRFGFK